MLVYFHPQHDTNHQSIVYDSLRHHSLHKRVLKKFMGTLDIFIKYARVQQQQDVEFCGLFVIAWAVNIAFGNNLEGFVYVKDDMW